MGTTITKEQNSYAANAAAQNLSARFSDAGITVEVIAHNAGKRFEFGKNWKKFLTSLNEERIKQAEVSLKTMLDVESLEGKSFLDIGSGSGLFSLAAKNLGAKVFSFDFDELSVW